MNIDAIPLFSVLKNRLGYLGQREKLIAQNVANADTPGYAPRDLQAFSVERVLAEGPNPNMLRPATTEAGHLSVSSSAQTPPTLQWKVETIADSESKLDGNKVVLEEEMSKLTEAHVDYQAAVGFYQKAMELLRMAAKPPGGTA